MSKVNLTIIVLIILIITLGTINGVLFLQKKQVVSYFLQEAKKIIPNISHYESSFLANENKVVSMQKYSPHTLSAIPFMPYETFRDLAKDVCETSGNYHLITMREWGIVAQAAKAEDLLPRGNNYFGVSKENPDEKCEVDPQNEKRCLTGTGPSSWCYRGICDLNGNLAEWVDFPEIQDGIVNIEGKEYVLVPANYDMEKALGKDGVENLIPEELDPNPDTPSTSGASVMINKNSEDFNYPKTIPIKRDTILGDFDQFRNGNAKDYGDGKYYLWIPTYDKNNNKKEDGPADVASEVLVCDTFDGGAFTDCEHYRGCPLNANQIKDGQRMSSVIPHLIYPKIEYQGKKYNCPSIAEVTILHLSGFISGLREGEDLKDFALPSSISEVPSTEFDSDTFKIAPYGRRFAVRGGKFDDEIGSGLFNLEMIIDERNNGSWDITYRCVKDY